MGAQQSLQGGTVDSKKVDTKESIGRTAIQQRIDGMMTDLLKRHMHKFQDKSFCSRTKLFVRDAVLMKTAEHDIKELNKDVFIGEVIGGAEEKPELCEQLSHHYLKKMNLVASIHSTIHKSYATMDRLQRGGQCFHTSPNQVSNAPYTPLFTAVNDLHHESMTTPYSFSKRHTLEVDSAEIRKMAFEKIHGHARKDVTVPEEAKNRLLFREITTPEVCHKQGGQWLEQDVDLVQRKMRPSETLKQYNQGWTSIVGGGGATVLKNSEKLLAILDEVVDERVEDIDGVKKKIYYDKAVTNDELNKYVKETRQIIQDTLSEVDRTYLMASSIPVISEQELSEQKALKQQQKELDERLKGIHVKLDQSNKK